MSVYICCTFYLKSNVYRDSKLKEVVHIILVAGHHKPFITKSACKYMYQYDEQVTFGAILMMSEAGTLS
jgi:hypothetical protein